jgi:hypothetical protein
MMPRAEQLVEKLRSQESETRLEVRACTIPCLKATARNCVEQPSEKRHGSTWTGWPPPLPPPPPPPPPLRELMCLPFTTRLQALRGIKNCVIGNKRQKLRYIQLGAVPLLVGVLAAPDTGSGDASQLVQAAAALGSFAASVEGLQVVLQSGAVPHLLRVLQSSGEDKVVEASVRALKAVCRVSIAPSACACVCRGRAVSLVCSLQAGGCTARQAAHGIAV